MNVVENRRAAFTLADLIDGQSLASRLAELGVEVAAAVPSYLRHKPNESTIVAFRFDVGSAGAQTGQTYGYAHWCASVARADDVYAKALTKRPRESVIGPGVMRLDQHTVLYLFPNDARLTRLRWYVDPRKVRRSLAGLTPDGLPPSTQRVRVDVLRYKPLRRVVVRVRLASFDGPERELFVRYTTGAGASALAEAAAHLHSYGVATPASIARLDNDHVSVDEFVAGEQLVDVVHTGRADAAAFASALRRLHTMPPLPGLSTRTAGDEVRRARDGLAAIVGWSPALAPLASQVRHSLARRQPTAGVQVLLHGDLHAKNVLVRAGEIVFVDLERLATGPAEVDAGYFLAHAIAAPIRGLDCDHRVTHAVETIDHYQGIGGAFAPEALAWHTAVGLVDQALLVIRHLESDWCAIAHRLLTLALEMCERPTALTAPTVSGV